MAAYRSDTDLSDFAILPSVIDSSHPHIPENLFRNIETYTMLTKIGLVFLLIPFKLYYSELITVRTIRQYAMAYA